jgi:hypothetical protein
MGIGDMIQAQRNAEDAPRYRAALEKIRFAGNASHPIAIWMQKVAAHAMQPEQWPDPGPAPSGGTEHE